MLTNPDRLMALLPVVPLVLSLVGGAGRVAELIFTADRYKDIEETVEVAVTMTHMVLLVRHDPWVGSSMVPRALDD